MRNLKIIMHNSVSLDGSFTGFEPDMGLHYQIAGEYKADAHLIGSSTIKTGAEAYGGKIPPEAQSDFTKPDRKADVPYWVVVDTKGITKGVLHTCRSFEFCRDVIVLVSEETGRDFLNYLEKRNYDYLVCGQNRVDFKQAFQSLNGKFGIKKILVDSGPVLNAVLLKQGLIDEISLLICPELVGYSSNTLLAGVNPKSQNVSLKLLACENRGENYIWLRYRVLKKKPQ